MAERKRQVVEVNRAPVMTLWAAVVARRLGHGHDEALTVAGLNAHSKAKRLGLIESEEKFKEERRPSDDMHDAVPLLGRSVPVGGDRRRRAGGRGRAAGHSIDGRGLPAAQLR